MWLQVIVEFVDILNFLIKNVFSKIKITTTEKK